MSGLLEYLTSGKAGSHATGLDPAFAAALQPFLQAAPGRGISIFSGYRSPEHQARLFRNALAKYGSESAARKWVAPPGRSRHNHGGAADLRYASDAVKAWAHENAANYGLNFRMKHEPWHIELAKAAANGAHGAHGAHAGYGDQGPPGVGDFLGLAIAGATAEQPQDPQDPQDPREPARSGLVQNVDGRKAAQRALLSEALGRVSV